MNQATDMPTDTAQPLRLIRLKEVKRRTAMSTSTIYRWMKAGKFPLSHTVGGYIAVWSEGEVEAWIEATLTEQIEPVKILK